MFIAFKNFLTFQKILTTKSSPNTNKKFLQFWGLHQILLIFYSLHKMFQNSKQNQIWGGSVNLILFVFLALN
jgi:hypothetical protein